MRYFKLFRCGCLVCVWLPISLEMPWAVITLLLHCYYTVVTLLLHCYYTVITLLLHCYYTFITLLLHFYFTVITLLLHCYYTFILLLLHCDYTFITLLLHCDYTFILLLLHCYYTVITLLLHFYYTVITLLLHCYYTVAVIGCNKVLILVAMSTWSSMAYMREIPNSLCNCCQSGSKHEYLYFTWVKDVCTVGPCTLRPTDFRFEMRKTKCGNELFPDYHLKVGITKNEKWAVIWFYLMCLNMEIRN